MVKRAKATADGKAQKQAEPLRPPTSGSFQPGQSGNPGGKPLNARNTVTKKFLEVLAKDFETNGEAAIVSARTADPMGYVRVIASLLPKEFVVERPLEQLSDEELAAAISDLRTRLGNVPATTAAQAQAVAQAGGEKATTH